MTLQNAHNLTVASLVDLLCKAFRSPIAKQARRIAHWYHPLYLLVQLDCIIIHILFFSLCTKCAFLILKCNSGTLKVYSIGLMSS